MLVFTKYQRMYIYAFDWATTIFYVQLIIAIYTIHVCVVQLNILWLIYLNLPSERWFSFTHIALLQYVLWASKSFDNWTDVNRFLKIEMILFSWYILT